MGFFDFLFGEGPSVDTQTLDTLTPEQQQALNSLLSQLSGGTGRGAPRRFEGDPNVEASDLSQMSLAGLEERALALSDPNRQNDIALASTDTLLKLLDFETQQAGVNEFFDTNIRDPALESFREDVLPGIGREFGGANFFGSERRTADERASEDLITQLTRSRSDINFRSDQANRDRAIQALGLAPGVDAIGRGDTEELLGLLQAGETQTGLAERNVAREFQQFLAESGLDDTQINQLLAGINTQAFENVVTAQPGSPGFIPQVLGALSGSTFNFGSGSTTIGGTGDKPVKTGGPRTGGR